ncbi:Glutamate receptor family protein [Euphorbia peplus]|nr:Glutamate receptor family protein [Euphorbia peplus]
MNSPSKFSSGDCLAVAPSHRAERLICWSSVQSQSKTHDAIVGDGRKIKQSGSHAESGLLRIVPAKSQESNWMFMDPFTWQMWAVADVGGCRRGLIVFIVWFLNHQSNPDFRGTLNSQIGPAVLFTFSSLFFAHREKICSNLTWLVALVSLFVVLFFNSSYTTSLTSLLAIQQLQPNVTDIDGLKRNNLLIRCNGDLVIRN